MSDDELGVAGLVQQPGAGAEVDARCVLDRLPGLATELLPGLLQPPPRLHAPLLGDTTLPSMPLMILMLTFINTLVNLVYLCSQSRNPDLYPALKNQKRMGIENCLGN